MSDVCYFIAGADGATPNMSDDDFVIATWGETTSTIERGVSGIIVFGTSQGMSNLSQATLGSGPTSLSGADFACDNAEGFSKVYDAFVGQ